MTYLIPILIIFILILLNGVYVAAEFAMASASHTRAAELAKSGSSAGQRIVSILRSPEAINLYISTAQVGITFATLGLGMYGEHTLAHWLEEPLSHIPWLSHTVAGTASLVLAIAIITYLHVVIGEMVPKSLALQAPVKAAVALNGVMLISERVFLPMTYLLNSIGNAILRLAGLPLADSESRIMSSAELEFIMVESSEEGLLDPEERVLLENVLDFRGRDASQVMTPRTRVVGLPYDLSLDETLQAICTSRHSRYPVYDDDLDHIVGILHTKDLARYVVQLPENAVESEQFTLRSLVRETMFVPERVSLEQLLAQFQEERTQIAAVVDEYGGVSGIVTLEDLAEELVGEIQDEHDQELPPFELLEENLLRVRGDLLLEELEQHFDLQLEHEDTDTIGGLVMALLGHVAEPQEEVLYDGLTFTVESIDGLAIETVLIQLPESNE